MSARRFTISRQGRSTGVRFTAARRGAIGLFYAQNFEALARHFHVILPDLPGHGYSGCPEMDYVIEDFSVALEAFLHRIGAGTVYIVAFGQAAGYAADFCYYNLGRVQRMVFINPGAYENTRSLYAKQLSGPMGGYFAGRMSRFQNGEKYLKRQLLDQTMLTDRDIEEFCRPYTRNGVRICTRLATVNYLEEDLEARCRQSLARCWCYPAQTMGFPAKGYAGILRYA